MRNTHLFGEGGAAFAILKSVFRILCSNCNVIWIMILQRANVYKEKMS